ncbi:MAG TPA: hypothetical protein VJ183_14345 [Chloroflexia bacterium]|nr:hypothetical protein [Chloroflexia bacterium]
MIAGIYAPNAEWNENDFHLFEVGSFRAVKLMWYHTPEDVARLRALGCEYFLVRLPDSVAERGRFRGDAEYANLCIDTISKFVPLGIRNFQLDNEPNMIWPNDQAGTWRWLLDRVTRMIRKSPNVPGDVRLGLAPLAWNPATWTNVQEQWIPEQLKILDQYDFVCVHSYWQSAETYNSPSFGGNAKFWHTDLIKTTKPTIVTEWASSIHETGIPAQQVEMLRVTQYRRWLDWVSTLDYVEATFLYILGGTNDWEGFWPTEKVLKAMVS